MKGIIVSIIFSGILAAFIIAILLFAGSGSEFIYVDF